MNMNALVNMVLRQLVRRAVNFGLGAGIKAVSNRSAAPKHHTGGAQPQPQAKTQADSQAEAGHLRAIRQMRRAQRNLTR